MLIVYIIIYTCLYVIHILFSQQINQVKYKCMSIWALPRFAKAITYKHVGWYFVSFQITVQAHHTPMFSDCPRKVYSRPKQRSNSILSFLYHKFMKTEFRTRFGEIYTLNCWNCLLCNIYPILWAHPFLRNYSLCYFLMENIDCFLYILHN